MGLTCTICSHPDRQEIESAIVSGEPQRAIANQWRVSRAAVQRHALRHVSPALAAVQAQREEDGAATLLDRVESLIQRTERLLSAAEQSGAVTTALGAVREQRELLRLLGAASGELDTRPVTVVNLQASPEWHQMRAVILAALMAYPDARAAVSGRLLELEAGS